MLEQYTSIDLFRPLRRKFLKRNSLRIFLNKAKTVKWFLEKKKTITFKKGRKQKRYLNNALLELHKKINELQPDMRMSVHCFASSDLFWIVTPNIKIIDYCLCVIHDKYSLLIKKLKVIKIIKGNSPKQNSCFIMLSRSRKLLRKEMSEV